MAMDLPEDAEDSIRTMTIMNAIEYGGTPDSKSVMGRIMSARPDLRSHAKKLMPLIDRIVSEVEQDIKVKGINAVREEIEAREGTLPERQTQKDRKRGLPDLSGNTDNIVLRFAPNPNGPLSLGHARGVVINAAYAKQYEGEFILRFDDTDTKVKPALPEAYEWILEDVEWLIGHRPDRVIIASDRIQRYLEFTQEIIEKGLAYVDHTPAQDFREMRAAGNLPTDRDLPVSEHLERWEMMIDGTTPEGGAVVRIRTSPELKNPALRDWPAVRIQEQAHPRSEVGQATRVWPLLDLQSAFDDHIEGVTHIIRGKDLMDSTRRQTMLYDGLGWTYPETIYWGRVKIHGLGAFSTSQMRRSVEEGEVSDWDDPRLPTLRSLKRRGYAPEAMKNFWIDLGLTRKDISVSMTTLDKFNTRKIDGEARRATLIREPVHIYLDCEDEYRTKTIELLIHPDHPERGYRELHLVWTDKGTGIHIESRDVSSLEQERRLRGWADIVATDRGATVLRTSREHGLSQIHWLPDGEAITSCLLEQVDGNEILQMSALIEGTAGDYDHGEIVQLERIGFARCEHREEGLVLMMLHG